MAQLIVRNLDDLLVRKLKIRAAEHGVSTEEEHRRILAEVLGTNGETDSYTFKDHLLALGDLDGEIEFDRPRTISKRTEFE
jgi:antitoxin FitA